MMNYGAPARYWENAALSDTVDLPGGESDYIYVGVTGNIQCDVRESSTNVVTNHLFSNLAVGYHPIRTTRIRVTGTTVGMLIKCARVG